VIQFGTNFPYNFRCSLMVGVNLHLSVVSLKVQKTMHIYTEITVAYTLIGNAWGKLVDNIRRLNYTIFIEVFP
jgi:hypothetical protein